jgi:hypothetical protein
MRRKNLCESKVGSRSSARARDDRVKSSQQCAKYARSASPGILGQITSAKRERLFRKARSGQNSAAFGLIASACAAQATVARQTTPSRSTGRWLVGGRIAASRRHAYDNEARGASVTQVNHSKNVPNRTRLYRCIPVHRAGEGMQTLVWKR